MKHYKNQMAGMMNQNYFPYDDTVVSDWIQPEVSIGVEGTRNRTAIIGKK